MINKNVPVSDILGESKQSVYNVKHCIHQSILALSSKNKGNTIFRPKMLLDFCFERIHLTNIVKHGY